MPFISKMFSLLNYILTLYHTNILRTCIKACLLFLKTHSNTFRYSSLFLTFTDKGVETTNNKGVLKDIFGFVYLH